MHTYVWKTTNGKMPWWLRIPVTEGEATEIWCFSSNSLDPHCVRWCLFTNFYRYNFRCNSSIGWQIRQASLTWSMKPLFKIRFVQRSVKNKFPGKTYREDPWQNEEVSNALQRNYYREADKSSLIRAPQTVHNSMLRDFKAPICLSTKVVLPVEGKNNFSMKPYTDK